MRRWVSPGVAWLLVALFATTPMVQLVTGSLFVENLLAAILLGTMTALWSFGETGERRSLYLAAALGGTAMAIKFGAIAFLAPALLCAAVGSWRRRKRPAPAGRSPPAAAARRRAALRHRLDQDRQSGLSVSSTRSSTRACSIPRPTSRTTASADPLTWNTPYDLTFRSNRYYEGQDGSFGFQYLVLAPLALLALLVAPRRQAVARPWSPGPRFC